RCLEFHSALAIYRRCAYPGSRLREIRVLERCAEIAQAYGLARAAWHAPESEAEQQALQRVLPRLRRKIGAAAAPPEERYTTGLPTVPAIERIDLVLPDPTCVAAQAATVEQLVCAHYSRAQAPMMYVENTLINSLFGLLCWQAIFAPLPGAFFHPFHHGPADLHSPDFHQRRAGLFAQC